MEPDRRRLIIIFVVVVIAIGIGWAYYAKKKTSQPAPAKKTAVSNLSNLDPTDFDAAVKSEYALAASKAIEVNPDYKVAVIEVNVDKDLSVGSISTRYIFTAPTDTANNWMITVAAATQSYIRALVPKIDYAGNVIPFGTNLWKYNYVTALQLAEKAGGLDWRNQNSLINLKLTLKTASADSILTWTVEYNGQNTNKTIILDAASGKVVE